MKICPNCHAQNEQEAVFCEQCGTRFEDVPSLPTEQASQIRESSSAQQSQQMQSSSRATTPVSKSKTPWLVTGGIVLLGIFVGLLVFFLLKKPEQPTAMPAASTSESTSKTASTETTSTSKEPDLAKYDETIKEAKELTIAGKYKESELKLASIPVSDLAKEEFAAIREVVQELTNQNNEGMKKQPTSVNDKKDTPDTTFVGDYAKWSNTYTFYYQQSNQKQSSLTIAANGGVTQNNNDGTQFFGVATIKDANGDVLSYETNELYPATMPDTKSINPNVEITVQWDNGGGTQVYYGYLSYSSRLALTDGISKGDGVNEVWVSY